MRQKLKVVTVVGTRPEIIRLSRVIAKLECTCEHILIHTGQNFDYELNQILFDDLGLKKPDIFLNAARNTPSITIGNILIAIDPILSKLEPEALLVLGDTNSCLSVIAAKRLKIPIFHMEAGNRCFDARVPEEINRRIVDHTADVNLTYSDIARNYLLSEGLPADLIIKIGSPMYEVINHYRDQIRTSDILRRLNLELQKYFVVSAHREENIDNDLNFSKLVSILNHVAVRYGHPIIVSTHPRTRKRVEQTGAEFHALVRFIKPLGFHDYVHLQTAARAVISDSGTITEEASILNFPALNLRETHERPEGMEEAPVIMTGLSVVRVEQALELIATQGRGEVRDMMPPNDYTVPNVSEKVVRILHSYTDYVRRTVWQIN